MQRMIIGMLITLAFTLIAYLIDTNIEFVQGLGILTIFLAWCYAMGYLTEILLDAVRRRSNARR